MLVSLDLFGRRVVVHRDFKPENTPRALRPGDVVRDRAFSLAIDVVTRVERDRIVLAEDDRCPMGFVHLAYEHADGAPISEVLP